MSSKRAVLIAGVGRKDGLDALMGGSVDSHKKCDDERNRLAGSRQNWGTVLVGGLRSRGRGDKGVQPCYRTQGTQSLRATRCLVLFGTRDIYSQ